MVHPVVRWGYQYMFQPAHFPYQLRMHKNSPYLGGGRDKKYVQGFETEEGQGHKIDEPIERLEHRRPKTHRKVVLLATMMRNMGRPKESYLMIEPM